MKKCLFIDLAATTPNAVTLTGPFITWSAPDRAIGFISSYVVRVISATGDAQYVMKNATSFSHVLSSSDIPSNLGGDTLVKVQVSEERTHTKYSN